MPRFVCGLLMACPLPALVCWRVRSIRTSMHAFMQQKKLHLECFSEYAGLPEHVHLPVENGLREPRLSHRRPWRPRLRLCLQPRMNIDGPSCTAGPEAFEFCETASTAAESSQSRVAVHRPAKCGGKLGYLKHCSVKFQRANQTWDHWHAKLYMFCYT